MAIKSQAYAKALYYKEYEFRTNPADSTKDLVDINQALDQPDAAKGVIMKTNDLSFDSMGENPRVRFFVSLSQWENALEKYEAQMKNAAGKDDGLKQYYTATVGKLQCLISLGRYVEVNDMLNNEWNVLGEKLNMHGHIFRTNSITMEKSDIQMQNIVDAQMLSPLERHLKGVQKAMAMMGATAAWSMTNWQKFDMYASYIDTESYRGALYRGVVGLKLEHLTFSKKYIDRASEILAQEIKEMAHKSYSRMYMHICKAQELVELEELLHFRAFEQELKQSEEHNIYCNHGGMVPSKTFDNMVASKDGEKLSMYYLSSMKQLWRTRLDKCNQHVDYYVRFLSIRSLVDPDKEDRKRWLKLAQIAQRDGRESISIKVLQAFGTNNSSLLQLCGDKGDHATRVLKLSTVTPLVRRESNVDMLQSLIGIGFVKINRQNDQNEYNGKSLLHPLVGLEYLKHLWHMDSMGKTAINLLEGLIDTVTAVMKQEPDLYMKEFKKDHVLRNAYLTLGNWRQEMYRDSHEIVSALLPFENATLEDGENYVAWHSWGLANFYCIKYFDDVSPSNNRYNRSNNGNDSNTDNDNNNEKLRSKIDSNGSNGDGSEANKNNSVSTESIVGERNNSDASDTNTKTMSKSDSEQLSTYLKNAITGFVKAIQLSRKVDRNGKHNEVIEDILRLLTLWFTYGLRPGIKELISQCIDTILPSTWLSVLPQLIARIQLDKRPTVNGDNWPMIGTLLYRVGMKYPQALVYPLTVAANSRSKNRKAAAEEVLRKLQTSYKSLFDQAAQVSQELIRVSVLWHEMWHDALEEACKKFFNENDVEGMLDVLQPMHESLNTCISTGRTLSNEPLSIREIGFIHSHSRDLLEAWSWCVRFQDSLNTVSAPNGQEQQRELSYIQQAWDIYYKVFKNVQPQKMPLSKIELKNSSPWLFHAHNLQIAVPCQSSSHDKSSFSGSGIQQVVSISKFLPTLKVMVSKQHPRSMKILGDDGEIYTYLLKGNEDLRQDERVMQLFGLVNSFLTNDRNTRRKNLSIKRYAVIPLSHEVGLVQWVHRCDTLLNLIKEYREERAINVELENLLMCSEASEGRVPDPAAYESLTIMQKVDIFQNVMLKTRGHDLQRILWLKSPNAEVWHNRRIKYTTSLAVMSMVGYILGLGDRHPSNLMLERTTGQIVHIDFGDCFEVAINRERFPEKVPFRLTRMLINAMAVSGIEGTYKLTCESVIRVMRENEKSVMTMLEAFVHDPLVNWGLTEEEEADVDGNNLMNAADAAVKSGNKSGSNDGVKKKRRSSFKRRASTALQSVKSAMKAMSIIPKDALKTKNKLKPLDADSNDDHVQDDEKLNNEALKIIQRVQDKLTGNDYGGKTSLTIENQVDRLVKDACKTENLAQMYSGWHSSW